MEKLKIYLAGGLFNAGQRLHVLYLAKYLRELGYTVILPMVEALKFRKGDGFDLPAVRKDCRRLCQDPKILYVGTADGPDADSGTCVEYGITITATGRGIVIRTDFRTAKEKEVGLNAMLELEGTTFIYHPCYFTDLDQVEDYYRELARKIHEAILNIAQ